MLKTGSLRPCHWQPPANRNTHRFGSPVVGGLDELQDRVKCKNQAIAHAQNISVHATQISPYAPPVLTVQWWFTQVWPCGQLASLLQQM